MSFKFFLLLFFLDFILTFIILFYITVFFSSVLKCRWYFSLLDHCIVFRKKIVFICFLFFLLLIPYNICCCQNKLLWKQELQFLSLPLSSFLPSALKSGLWGKKMLLCTLFLGGCVAHYNLILHDQPIFWETLFIPDVSSYFVLALNWSLCHSSCSNKPNHIFKYQICWEEHLLQWDVLAHSSYLNRTVKVSFLSKTV